MIRVPAISIWSEVYSAAGDPPPALRFAAGMSAVGFAGAFLLAWGAAGVSAFHPFRP